MLLMPQYTDYKKKVWSQRKKPMVSAVDPTHARCKKITAPLLHSRKILESEVERSLVSVDV